MKQQPQINTLSELLATAIADARRLDRDQYQPRYRNWHFPNSQGFCEICLGGIILAETFECSPKKNYAPWEFPPETHNKIEALEAMRTGAWLEAYHLVYQHSPPLEIEARLCCLPTPSWAAFVGWRQFNSHLKSLESILPKLRSIESSDDHIEALKG